MKYRLTNETIKFGKVILHRIECVKAFADVKVGDKGGWIEKESNLSQTDNAWVYGDAEVYGNAEVFDNAEVYGNARVSGCAEVHGNAQVFDSASLFDNARMFDSASVFGYAEVFGSAQIYDCAVVNGYAVVHGDAKILQGSDYIVFKNNFSSGRYFTWTRSNNMWTVGCFHGTGEQLIEKARQDNEDKAKCYALYVKLVEDLQKVNPLI